MEMPDIKLDPSDWFDNYYDFYDYFYHQRFSMSYCHKILKLLNLWGFFICKKLGKPFLPIPHPKGYERQRILDAFYEKNDGKGKQSAPLRPSALVNVRHCLKEHQYNWLHLSVWFGLRPKEIDNLHDEGLWKVETLRDDLKILWVYQTKIVSLPPVDRWKPIPILFAEQEEGLRMIRANSFSRPLVKTVRRYLGEDVSLYGGRKGFTDLMLEKGHHLEAISQWMGHSTLDRTWRSYKDRRRLEFSLPA